MTATENLQSSTRPAPSAETVIAVRGLTKVFKGGLPGVVNLNSQVDPVRARGALRLAASEINASTVLKKPCF